MKSSKSKDITINDLAVMVKNGFDQMDERFDKIDKRFLSVEGRLNNLEDGMGNLDSRMSGLERELSAVRYHLVYKEDFEDLMARVKYIESKLKIESGK